MKNHMFKDHKQLASLGRCEKIISISSVMLSGHCIIVIQLIIILQHLSLYLGWIYPGNEVFHIPCYKECWVSNRLWTHSHMSLLNVCDRFFQVLTKLQAHQNSWEPTPTRKSWNTKKVNVRLKLCKPVKG